MGKDISLQILSPCYISSIVHFLGCLPLDEAFWDDPFSRLACFIMVSIGPVCLALLLLLLPWPGCVIGLSFLFLRRTAGPLSFPVAQSTHLVDPSRLYIISLSLKSLHISVAAESSCSPTLLTHPLHSDHLHSITCLPKRAL